jgi:hypothetical protein
MCATLNYISGSEPFGHAVPMLNIEGIVKYAVRTARSGQLVIFLPHTAYISSSYCSFLSPAQTRCFACA